MRNYILASASPRRSQLLEQIGLDFQVIPSNKEEVITKTLPDQVVEELSYQKCLDIAEQICNGNRCFTDSKDETVVIGADTIVAYQNQILRKPQNKEDAYQTLMQLAGHEHSVFTGVTLALIKEHNLLKTVTFHEETKVIMKSYNEDMINRYIATKEPMDKAGSYGIQGKGAVLVHHIEGDYNNVVGLPLSHLYDELHAL